MIAASQNNQWYSQDGNVITTQEHFAQRKLAAIRSQRAKKTAEVFTTDGLVGAMLSKLPKEVWEEGKTFIDPAGCGNGQFLMWAFIRKIGLKHNVLNALKTLYGVDIVQENVNETRLRLLKVAQMTGENIAEQHVRIVMRNIFWCRSDVYPRGALDYDFEFNHEIKSDRAKKYSEWAIKMLKAINPVTGRCHVDVPPIKSWVSHIGYWFYR